MNNNEFNEGPVLNNVIEEDDNNNGDINGNSDMIDLHNRRIQEEREREEEARQRVSQQQSEEAIANEMQDLHLHSGSVSEIQRHSNTAIHRHENIVEENNIN